MELDRVCATIPSIAARLGLPSADGLELMRSGYDLYVHFEHAAVYVAMVSLMIGWRAREDTMKFGRQ